MGTFIIRPTVLASGGTPFSNGPITGNFTSWFATTGTLIDNISDPLKSVSGVCGDFTAPFDTTLFFSDTARFSFAGNSIYLDGSLVPIDINSLPSGFSVSSASLKVDWGYAASDPANTSRIYIQKNIVQETELGAPITDPTGSADIAYFGAELNIIILTGLGVGIRANLNNGVNQTNGTISGFFSNLRIEGEYITEQFSNQLTWNIPDPGPYKYGEYVIIKGKDGNPNLNDVDNVTVLIGSEEVPADIIYQDETTIIFIMPDPGGNTGDLPVTLNSKINQSSIGKSPVFSPIDQNGDGDGDSGLGKPIYTPPVSPGIIEVLYANGSGMYTLVPNKRDDTLYLRDEEETTIDLAIPAPFIKTGFFGS